MRANSVRIHAQKLSTNFSKDSCRILTRLRCAQIHMPKTKVENSIEDLASNMFNSRSYKFRTVGVELARVPTNLFIEHSPQTYPTVPSSFDRVISFDKVHY